MAAKGAWAVPLLACLGLLAAGCAAPPPAPPPPPRPAAPPAPRPAPAPAGIVFAGVRSSSYGIKPFPEPAAWQRAILAMAAKFEGATPGAIWIVGVMAKTPRFVHVDFPAEGRTVPYVEFDSVDKPERYLDAFDGKGIKVYLQVEPANADVPTLIDLVLGRYGHHPCVVGFGIDVEWNKTADRPRTGMPVNDATARAWEARVKSFNPSYRLFLKHWDPDWMPQVYRGDIVFVDDSQIFPDMEAMVKEFGEDWAPRFYPNLVMFQVGYNSDKPWWSGLADPPRTLGDAIRARVKQDMGIIWVDFSLRDVLPIEGDGRP